MDNKMLGGFYRKSVICVDSFENGIFQGRLYQPYLGKMQSFDSLLQLLKGIEQFLDEMNFPKPFTTVRTFSAESLKEPKCVEEAGLRPEEGKLATFAVNVMFRQNSCWQGSLCWLDRNAEESFRSVLELIWLMDSALSGANA